MGSRGEGLFAAEGLRDYRLSGGLLLSVEADDEQDELLSSARQKRLNVAVVRRPDEEAGEIPKAFVVVKPDPESRRQPANRSWRG